MYPPGYHHNGFMATYSLLFNHISCTQVYELPHIHCSDKWESIHIYKIYKIYIHTRYKCIYM